ncbi:MAG: hypothetical protein A2W19_02240 [Spirochaetes bacterium RBG_16_49_21]|nr:MAG: hypothetical protein A2W19_02240 [Spirochaetes bacterium RBG_16_49_21]
MTEEVTKPNLEVVPGGGGTPDLGDMGSTPPGSVTPPETPSKPATKPTPDERLVILDGTEVKTAEDLTNIFELARYGRDKYLAEVEAKKAKDQGTEQDHAAKTAKVDFYAKYGDRFHRAKDGTISIPPDLMMEIIQDTKTDSERIADERVKAGLDREREEVHQQRTANERGRNIFWKKAENQDLRSATYMGATGKMVKAADEIDALVEAGVMKPSVAAAVVRDKIQTARANREMVEKEARRVSAHYEGNNWEEDMDPADVPAPIRAVKPRLDDIKKKPEGERGSRSFFSLWDE